MPPIVSLVAAIALFMFLHLIVAGTRIRDRLIGMLGHNGYLRLLSVPIVASLVWMGFAYVAARRAESIVYWSATLQMKEIQLGLMLVAFLFIVLGRSQRNPTGVFQESTLDKPEVISGMLRISRHPYLWGVALWATGHLLVSGDRASVILFASLLFVVVFGTFSIDAKRRREFGARWEAFAKQTSNVPFAAILLRRQALPLGEIAWWRIGLALAVWAGLILAHQYVFGVPALPWTL